MIIIAIYVDDMLFFSNDRGMIDEMKNNLKSEFSMKDLGRASSFLAIQLGQKSFSINPKSTLKICLKSSKLSKKDCSADEEEKRKMNKVPYQLDISSKRFFLI
ncbi:hypothetical protein ACFFRR_000359 [Megaselia abdita]